MKVCLFMATEVHHFSKLSKIIQRSCYNQKLVQTPSMKYGFLQKPNVAKNKYLLYEYNKKQRRGDCNNPIRIINRLSHFQLGIINAIFALNYNCLEAMNYYSSKK